MCLQIPHDTLTREYHKMSRHHITTLQDQQGPETVKPQEPFPKTQDGNREIFINSDGIQRQRKSIGGTRSQAPHPMGDFHSRQSVSLSAGAGRSTGGFS